MSQGNVPDGEAVSVTDPVTSRSPRRRRYGTRVIMTAVAIGAAWGLVQIPLNFVVNPIATALPVLAVASYGVWGMAALVPLAVLQRAGTGVIGSTASGVVASLSPYGLFMVMMMLGWGALMELPFLLLRYRGFGWPAFLFAGALTGVIATGMTWMMLDLGSLQPVVEISTVLVAMASFVGCALLSWMIGKALIKAGIGDGKRPIEG